MEYAKLKSVVIKLLLRIVPICHANFGAPFLRPRLYVNMQTTTKKVFQIQYKQHINTDKEQTHTHSHTYIYSHMQMGRYISFHLI